jgi:hypothetical protein
MDLPIAPKVMPACSTWPYAEVGINAAHSDKMAAVAQVRADAEAAMEAQAKAAASAAGAYTRPLLSST